MGGGKHSEGQRDRQVNGPPFAHHAGGQAVPEKPLLDFRVGETRIAEIGFCLFHPALRALDKILARQTAGDVYSHGGDSEPGEDGIEVNACVDEDERGADPGQPFVQSQQADRVIALDHAALAQGMAERQQYQDHAGDPEVAPDPDHIRQVENEVDEQGDSRKDDQPEVEWQDFADEKADSHPTGA